MNTSAITDIRLSFEPDRWLELVEVSSELDLRRELLGRHPADIAFVLEQLPYELQKQLFSLLDPDVIHQVAAELDEHDQARLIGKLPSQEIAGIAEKLESDDAADLIGVLKDEKAEEGFDPALATGPFITTTNDIIGLLIYLGIAAIFLTRY